MYCVVRACVCVRWAVIRRTLPALDPPSGRPPKLSRFFLPTTCRPPGANTLFFWEGERKLNENLRNQSARKTFTETPSLRQTWHRAPPHSLNMTPRPGTGRPSSKDAENARTAEQARKAPHLLMKTCWTLPCNTYGESIAFASARLAKKLAVSTLHLPPTSAAKTTKRALLPSPKCAPCEGERHPMLPRRGRPHWACKTRQDNLQTSSVQVVELGQVDPDVEFGGTRAPTSLFLGRNDLQRAASPQHPATAHAAR